MKNVLIMGTVLLSMAACNKNEGNKNVLAEENTHETQQQTASQGLSGSYTYKATDGTRAKIDFAEKDKTVTIEANGKKFQLDQVKVEANGTEYERNGIRADIKGDSVIISQGDNIIELVKDK